MLSTVRIISRRAKGWSDWREIFTQGLGFL